MGKNCCGQKHEEDEDEEFPKDEDKEDHEYLDEDGF